MLLNPRGNASRCLYTFQKLLGFTKEIRSFEKLPERPSGPQSTFVHGWTAFAWPSVCRRCCDCLKCRITRGDPDADEELERLLAHRCAAGLAALRY